MCARFLVLLLFTGITQKTGLAASETSLNTSKSLTPPNTYNFDVAVKNAFNAIAKLQFVTDLVRGATNCRAVFAEVVSQFGSHLETLHSFVINARNAYKNYQECNEMAEANAAFVCKEVAKYEYYDTVRTGFRKLGETFRGIVSNAMKLPSCYFVRE